MRPRAVDDGFELTSEALIDMGGLSAKGRELGSDALDALLQAGFALRGSALGIVLGGGARRFSSQGGWQSDSDLLQWPHKEIATLRAEFTASITRLMQLAGGDDPNRRVLCEFSAVSWANVNRDGCYNVIHNHPGNHWSGVYYVSLGEPDPTVQWNGAIEFYDPRGGATAMPVPGFNFGFSNAITPEPGTMIIFPSWLMHSVHPYKGPGVRISIALNATITNLQIAG